MAIYINGQPVGGGGDNVYIYNHILSLTSTQAMTSFQFVLVSTLSTPITAIGLELFDVLKNAGSYPCFGCTEGGIHYEYFTVTGNNPGDGIITLHYRGNGGMGMSVQAGVETWTISDHVVRYPM